MALTDEQKQLVQEFRQQRRARNMRMLGEGVSGLGRTMRGQAADVDQAFIQGGAAGEEAWMTPAQKQEKLQELELEQRREQLQRDKMDQDSRLAMLSYIQNAYEGARRSHEAELDREQQRAFKNAELRMRSASQSAQRDRDRSRNMDQLAEWVDTTWQAKEAADIHSNYEQLLQNEGLAIQTSSPQYIAGNVQAAPVYSEADVALRLESVGVSSIDNATPEQLETAIRETIQARDTTPGAMEAQVPRAETLAAERLYENARDSAIANRDANIEGAIILGANRYHRGNDGLNGMDANERTDFYMSLRNTSVGDRADIASSEDWAIREQHDARNRANIRGAVQVAAQVARVTPQAFDPTATAQIQEAARLMGFRVHHTAGEAIGAAQESAGRAGVTETAEIAEGAQQLQEQTAEEGWLGIPQLEKPSDPREQNLQAMELIEQFPELPPLQYARQQLVQSPQFAQYQQSRGYTDERETIKEMVKEARQMDRENRRATREAAKENRRLGIVPDPETEARREDNEPPEAPPVL